MFFRDEWSFSLVEEDTSLGGPVDPLMPQDLAMYVRGPRSPRIVLTITHNGSEVFIMRTRSQSPDEPMVWFSLLEDTHPLVALMRDANRRRGG